MIQNIENIYEIDLKDTVDSKALVDNVINALEKEENKNILVKLNLGENKISQSQMVFIKSLIESYGSKLGFVETQNRLTKDICSEIGINITEKQISAEIKSDSLNDMQNEELDDLREQFKTGFENEKKKEEEEERAVQPVEDKLPQSVELVKPGETETQKQVISIYRKADEKENELEFQDGDEVDFYAAPTDETVTADTKNTIYINQTLRNGQTVDYDGNVVIIGDCHPGSEIKATGDITVWGVLGSIAHAGAKGNVDARIRALKINAVQLRIANCYSRRPDCGNIPYIVRSSVFTPEEARISDDNIVLFKMAQN